MFNSETRIPLRRPRGQGAHQILKINCTHPRASEPTRSVQSVRGISTRCVSVTLQSLTRGAISHSNLWVSHNTWPHKDYMCVKERMCDFARESVFPLRQRCGSWFHDRLEKVVSENGQSREDPLERDKRKIPKVIRTPVIICLHISSPFALPSCLKDADWNESHSFYGALRVSTAHQTLVF